MNAMDEGRRNDADEHVDDGALTDATDASSDEYDVDSIVSHAFVNGEKKYLVRWANYSEAEQTWETESNVMKCASDKVHEFESRPDFFKFI